MSTHGIPVAQGLLRKALRRFGFIAKYETGSHDLLWSTYVSGEAENVLESISIGDGKIFVAGYTEDYGFPVQAFGDLYFQDQIISSISTTNQGGIDGIVMAFEPSTAFAYSTYFGGDQGFFGDNIYTTAYHDHRLYLGGTTSKGLDPTTYFPLDNAGGPPAYFDGQYHPAPLNYTDGFMAAICTEFFTTVPERVVQTTSGLLIHPLGGPYWSAVGLGTGMHRFELYDIEGRLVHTEQHSVIEDSPTRLRFPPLAEGIYTIRALGPDGPRVARVFVPH